jgi:ATP-dependent DNA helicase DinG
LINLFQFRGTSMHPLNTKIFDFFEDELTEYFEKNGQSSEIRWQQITMSQIIANSIESKKSSVIEAKVGTGKTLAYLFPLHFMVNNMNSKGPVIISTSSINLQEQILNKDLKLLEDTGYYSKAIIAKGSQQYLCKLNYKNFQYKLHKMLSFEELQVIEQWVKSTKTGDRSEVGEIKNDVWKIISIESTQDCGSCPFYPECKYWNIRSEIKKHNYDFIITNHNQLLQDLRTRYEDPTRNTIFPSDISAIVIDEAHNLEQAGVSMYSEKFYIKKLIKVFNSIVTNPKLVIALEKKNNYRKSMESFEKQIINKLRDYKEAPSRMALPDTIDFKNTLKFLLQIFKDLLDTVYLQADKEIYLIDEVNNGIEFIYNIQSDSYVVWYEPESKNIITLSKSVNKNIDDLLIYQNKGKKIPIIMTSATLSSNNSFDYFYRTIGQDKDEWESFEKELPSPFLYKEQALLYIADDILEFSGSTINEKYYDEINEKILDLLTITNGRALVLFTSHEHMKSSYDQLMSKSLPWKILSQADGSKEHISKEFKNSIESTVLFATGAFWEGFDVPGEQLVNVIIVRLPFSPDDPYIEFKKEEAKKQKLNDFIEISLPEMIIKMKQGFGRLIRKRSDYGIISILDKRVLKKSYGKVLLNAFPEISYSTDLKEVERFITMKQAETQKNETKSYSRDLVEYTPLPDMELPAFVNYEPVVAGIIQSKTKVIGLKKKYSCSFCGQNFYLTEKPEKCLTKNCKGRTLIEGYAMNM